ncbi:N-acyl homoserine lactonase family protein [Nocardia pseudobrasiliensis]|uniref:Glyoxylase-like metal-dependent hydrolase (Beta-lactamase superfamily II) n=1 Tax=Nocardia pseudobrasiliensis TaxID=45979 RepID=A0A370ICD6_9NOCA|nr:N-acyl homoserine lactonase family protein [Nocardia pseudobrasiliensis]RDI68389.1 glyoxylase-like metal-dependent hydrolase (beta-lactamase superfamily II) [Nocardia pseudobrasiliensis]
MSDDEYEVILVRYGTQETVRSDIFLNYPVYGADDGPITLDFFFWVVRGRDRTFIVDVGFSSESGRKRAHTLLLDPIEALRTLGIDPTAENNVIITHAHYDHIGNLAALPNSRFMMSWREYEFWTSELAGKELFRFASEVREIEQLKVALREERLRFVEHGHIPAPGITILEMAGHTPGQLAVVVETSSGPVLLASDAVHFYEELERDMPFALMSDLPQMYTSYATIRDMQLTRPHHLVTGHDPATLQRFPPLPGPLAAHAAVIGRLPISAATKEDSQCSQPGNSVS